MDRGNTAQRGISLREVFPHAQFFGAGDSHVLTCCSDSRRVQPGDVFVALPGVHHDGHDYTSEAVARGATAILAERMVAAGGLPICLVDDSRMAYGHLCQALVQNPSRQLHLTGITGTNGKTSTARLLTSILRSSGRQSGCLGTLGLDDSLEVAASTHTTPPAPVLAHWLSSMVAAGCQHGVMEVSSHALSQVRTAGIEFAAAVYTNLRRDHLDYHGTLANYHRAKARLRTQLANGGLLVFNGDDKGCQQIAGKHQGPRLSFGMATAADLTAKLVERHAGEQVFLLRHRQHTAAVRTRIVGDYHISNCLAAAGVALGAGIPLTDVVRGLERVATIPGRLERVDCGQPFGVYVDYAHTPDALSGSLSTLHDLTEGRLICVFGAGGDRDPDKRPQMAVAVQRWTDLAVVTNDNPRGEDPRQIAAQIVRGFNPMYARRAVHLELDRAAAIQLALHEARAGDTVLIAGRGHEQIQHVGRQTIPFDDRAVARGILQHIVSEERTL